MAGHLHAFGLLLLCFGRATFSPAPVCGLLLHCGAALAASLLLQLQACRVTGKLELELELGNWINWIRKSGSISWKASATHARAAPTLANRICFYF